MKNIRYIVGIDEVGRGTLAGPVTVAAFCIEKKKHDKFFKKKLKDSKALTVWARQRFSKEFHEAKKLGEVRFSITSISENIIDRQGIVYAVHQAINRSLGTLRVKPKETEVLLDGGLKAPPEYVYQKTIIRGDEKHPIIAAASIVAKVHRDKLMINLAKKFPEYGFEKHKGYGTKAHYKALKKHGPAKIHRKTFV